MPHMKDNDRAATIRKYTQAAAGEKRRARGLAEALADVPMKHVHTPRG